jgi:hypothetical protein
MANIYYEQIVNQSDSYMETNLIDVSIDTLIESRRILKNTYIYGFFLYDKKSVDILEFLQSSLEKETENLRFDSINKNKVGFWEIVMLKL